MSDETTMLTEWRGAHRRPVEGEADARVVLVGEDNPQSSLPEHALFPHPPGCAGHRLSQILGLTRARHLALWRTNLCCPTWSTKKARERAVVLLRPDAPWNVLVLLGRKVAQAFERVVGQSLDPFSITRVDGTVVGAHDPECVCGGEGGRSRLFTLVSLPHPSGRNLVWNDRSAWLDARKLMQQVAPDVEWGGT